MRDHHSEEDFKFDNYQQSIILDSHDKSSEKTLKEVEDLSVLHPNTEFDGIFRIFMQFYHGNISKKIKERKNQNRPWTDSELINHFITIARIIETLHCKDSIHRDMKPDNIFFIDNEELRIRDFGESKEIIFEESKYIANWTDIYMSPSYIEYWRSLPVNKVGKKRSEENRLKEEVWSVGKIFYEMAALDLHAKFPASENKTWEIIDNKLRNRPANLRILLKWLLSDDYRNRPKIEMVLEELQKIAQENKTTLQSETALQPETTFTDGTTRLGANSSHQHYKEGNVERMITIQEHGSNQSNPDGKFSIPHSSFKRYCGLSSSSVNTQEEIKEDQSIFTNTQEEIKHGETVSANTQEEIKKYQSIFTKTQEEIKHGETVSANTQEEVACIKDFSLTKHPKGSHTLPNYQRVPNSTWRMMRRNHSEEYLKFAYYQHFNILDSYDKSSEKTLKVVKFTFKEGPKDSPKAAILKQFYRVCKKYKKEAKFLEEFSALHPNIVKHYYHTEFEGTFRIFMEYCYGSVSKVIGGRENKGIPWTDSELINHFITIARVIKFLHDNDYIHGDMKPDNIFFIDNEELRIGDFGESKEIISEESKYTEYGTEIYMSPSYLKHWRSLPVNKDGKKISEENRLKEEEVWSVGKTFYEMAALDLHAKFPASEDEICEIIDYNLRNRTEKLRSLLRWMLTDNYTERPKIKEVLKELQKIAQETERTFSNYTAFSHDTSHLSTNSTDLLFKVKNADGKSAFQEFSSNKNCFSDLLLSDSVKCKEEIKQGEAISANYQEEVKQYPIFEEFDSDENNEIMSTYIFESCNSDLCIECTQPFEIEIYDRFIDFDNI